MIQRTIDLWFEDLSVTSVDYQNYWNILDDIEKNKALRFVHKIHRDRYVVSHGKLRVILATYVDMPPGKICFVEEAFGKPYIYMDGKAHKVKFNLSHTADKLIVAVCPSVQLGVDIEKWNGKIDYKMLAKECFSEVEYLYWLGLPEGEKTQVFYQFWTRKESFVKAVGTGISLDVTQIITSIDKPTRLISIPECFGLVSIWELIDLNLDDGMSGALTVQSIKNDQFEVNFFSL